MAFCWREEGLTGDFEGMVTTASLLDSGLPRVEGGLTGEGASLAWMPDIAAPKVGGGAPVTGGLFVRARVKRVGVGAGLGLVRERVDRRGAVFAGVTTGKGPGDGPGDDSLRRLDGGDATAGDAGAPFRKRRGAAVGVGGFGGGFTDDAFELAADLVLLR